MPIHGTLIASFDTPVDPGGGNPGRAYNSPVVGAGWTHLNANINFTGFWPGSFALIPGETGALWFNSSSHPPPPFTFDDPNQSYVTTANDYMQIQTNGQDAGLQVHVDLYGDQTGPCSAGSQAKPGSPSFFTYTEGDLAQVLPGNIGVIIWGVLGIPTSPQATADFCAIPPPTDLPTTADYVKLAFPPIALATGTYRRFANQVVADKWASLCQCTPPGSYTPPAPPPPPIGFPTLPSGPTCTTIQDVCNQIEIVKQQLAYLTQSLLASQASPIHSLSEGVKHSGLSGTGEISLQSSAIGVRVLITTDILTQGSFVGDPTYLRNRGFIVPITSEGPQRLQPRIAYSPQLFMLPPLTIRVGYTFTPGIVAQITEITAGP